MSSAKKRLAQIKEQVLESPSNKEGPIVDVVCRTFEHSPRHNVAIITLSNPTKLNIASTHLLEKLIHVCGELGKDPALRAVVLTGAPPTAPGKAPAFVGGADVEELLKVSSPDEARKYVAPVHNACVALQNIPVPVIARVHGFVIGAGLELMISCDLRVATKTSKFGMPEAKIGLPSVVEAALLPSFIGIGRTRRLLYLGENISAGTAEKWGLVERIVDNETELDQAVDEWVNILVQMGPKSIRNQKRLMRKWENSTLEDGIEAGVEALAEAYSDGGKEPKDYLKKFLGRNR